MRFNELIPAIDARVVGFTRRHGMRILRLALGIVFVWFGALKVFGASPVADLVASMLSWLPQDLAVRGLGVLEVLVGFGLITGVAIRVTLALFFVQMIGTFAVLLVHAPAAFDGNPLRLTLLGEFVVKNLVLLAAGVAIAGAVRSARPGESIPQILTESLHDRPVTRAG
jgi:putative oxidoreductase